MLLGAHESVSGGLHLAIDRGLADGCEAIQIFTKNASRWNAKPITETEADQFRERWSETDIGPVVSHDSYLINLCAIDDEKLAKSIAGFVDELQRAEQLGLSHLITHPGSHLGAGEDVGIKLMIESINQALEESETEKVIIALETTAGQGTNLGYRFEHLRDILAGVKAHDRFAICFDTAHTLAAGYDIRTKDGYKSVFADFDKIIGLNKLEVFHLNDSKKDLDTRVDRHDNIGEGFLGVEPFKLLVNDPRFAEIPGILETPALPDKTPSFAHNLKLLKSYRA